MNPLALLLLGTLAVLSVFAAYAAYRVAQARIKTNRIERAMEHEKRMKREDRDYDALVEYADNDDDRDP